MKLLDVVFFLFVINVVQVCVMDAACNNSEFNLQDISSVQKIIYEIFAVDQQFRTEFLQDRHNPEIIEKMHAMDFAHTQIMKQIIAIHGWLKISKFGKETDAQAWLLVQHADHDPQFQQQCLHLLSVLIMEQEETNLKNYAYLYDRVALNQGNKQKYGTQCCVLDSGEVVLRPYEGTLQDLAEQRKEVGLIPIEDYIEQMKMVYKK